MISSLGWRRRCIWEHSATVRELYARRCRMEAEEMTCHAQAVELLAPFIEPGDALLDVGCGSGYFWHSFRKRRIPVEYYGIDASPSLIEIGRSHLPRFGLDAERLQAIRIEDVEAEVDHVACLNVISNIDNYHRPLEIMLKSAAKSVVLRESCGPASRYAYVRDKYLDEGCDLRVHVNVYALEEVLRFIESYGFDAWSVEDRRTGGKAEMVIDHPHYWTFIVAKRKGS